MDSAQLFESAMQLTAEERHALALALLDSLGPDDDDFAAVESAWRDEVDRRIAAYRDGSLQGVPWDEARGRMFPR